MHAETSSTTQQNENQALYYDNGKVIAGPNLRLQHPWEVRPSTRIKGQYFFFNLETKESVWDLDPRLLDTTYSPAQQGKPPSRTKWLPPLLNAGGATTTEAEPIILTVEQQISKTSALPFGCNPDDRAKLKAHSAPLSTYNGAAVAHHHGDDLIKIDTLVVVDGLGQGGFADVVEVKDMETGKSFAMKVIAKKRLKRPKSREHFSLELRMMTMMKPSPFVQRCYAAFECPSDVFFVMNLNSGGDLHTIMVARHSEDEGEGTFSEGESRVFLAELAIAIRHVHDHKFIHKDIKAENVMLDRSGHVKLVDFGLAEVLEAETGPLHREGSAVYMPPELLFHRTGGRYTDWWSFGILAYEMLTARYPWSSISNYRIIAKEIRNAELIYPNSLTPLATLFLKGLCQPDYKARLGTKSDQDVQDAPFFNGIDWEATARLECAPAFVPSRDPVNEATKQQVLASYNSRREVLDSNTEPWYLGLDRVMQHPPFHANQPTGLPRLF